MTGRTARAAAPAALALTAALVLAGCGGDSEAADPASGPPHLKITGAFVPQPVTRELASAFFTVTNSGSEDTLTSVGTDVTDDVSLHTTTDGTMEERSSFPVPAGGTLDFARGGNHVMLEKLDRTLRTGQHVSLQLHFRKSGAITVEAPVKPPTYDPGKSS
ncbi:copper chaperone PCu(A)C [Streptomyces sp. NPDC050560]|uniref:copper chaperone PCu(A)C n=1 Tax=Streptomyces sp. NPDC050560 TaxID=3365630 RepID=UPI0037B9E26C